mgnify:CR=1 FL=1
MVLYFDQFEKPDPIHGIVDGATTDAVIKDIQNDIAKSLLGENGQFSDLITQDLFSPTDENGELYQLAKARVHLEIISGIKDKSVIAKLSQGRNTSTQVKKETMAHFNGHFDWIKEILDKQKYGVNIGYEENADSDIDKC